MRLVDAVNSRQVEDVLSGSRGKKEAEELRNDIDYMLNVTIERIERRWVRCDTVPDLASVIREDADDKFVDWLIGASPPEYNLRLVPRENVKRSAITYAASGVWRVVIDEDDVRQGELKYKIDMPLRCLITTRWFPTNYAFIPAVFAPDFWDRLGAKLGVQRWERSTDEMQENWAHFASRGNHAVAVRAELFAEWCRDLISAHIDRIARETPDETVKMFRRAFAERNSHLAERFFAARPSEEDVLNLAVSWFSGDRDDVEYHIYQWLKAVGESGSEGAQLDNREVVAEVTEDDLRKIGVTTGVIWENRPWKLIKLEPQDLSQEGLVMRHCVGSRSMRYIQAVQKGEIQIWSLRSKDNKPRFTLEVDKSFYEAEGMTYLAPGPTGRDRLIPVDREYRARAIKQVKGKANRLPGYADAYGRSGVVKFFDEVLLWAQIFDQLKVDAAHVNDFYAFRVALDPEAPRPPQPNPDNACVGFDVPYRPLKRR